MAFQNNEDHFLFVSSDVRPFHDYESWECPDSTAQDSRNPACSSRLDPPQYYWSDGSIFDLLTGMAVTPFHTHPPHTSQVLLEPPDQQANPLLHDTVDIGHTAIADVGAEPNVVGFSRRRTSNPVRRRALESRKSHRIDEIRKIMGMRDRTPKLQVLNAAIQRLGGVVPQSASGNNVDGMKLAYEALHERTGSQGRLRHVECLVLVIKALKGESTLNPIFVGKPNRSTRA